ncbi:TonB-dependent siderophore receptor [Sphingomonas sp. MS122]|uniref:TonB-dependent siderophore receptor n=1 Tax=Sphingomonas sp. MS122 TaxID=3412683 RepID=UPI003C30534E
MTTTYRLLTTVALVLVPTAALAQEETAEEKAKAEEIVVYGRGEQANSLATGLDLSPRETPQSISVITREQMEDQAVANIADALAYTTGISVKAVDRGRNMLAARGFEITNFQIDGAPFVTGNIGLEENSSAIYERIEVIRGANGLTQGAGEPSATINLVRKHATSPDLKLDVSLEAGSWGRMAATADISTPLTRDGSVRGRLVAQYYAQDSFIDIEQTDGYLLYGVIDADLGANTRISLGASYSRDDRDGILWGQLPYWHSDGTRTDWPRSKTTGAQWNRWDTVETTAFLTVEQRLGSDWSLRGDVSYHQQDEESKLLWTTGYPDPVTGLGIDASAYWYKSKPQQWHASASLKGGFDLFGQRHELILGGTYRHLEGGWTNRDPDPATVAPIGDFNQWDGNTYPEPSWGERYRMSGFGTTEQYAVYGATRLQLLDRLKLIAGGRFSWWERNEEVALYTPAPFTISHKAKFTPYAGLILDVTRNVSAYVSYTSIFNPQDYKDVNRDYLPPLVGNNYEAGLKGEWMGGRLRASAAIFRIEQDNFPRFAGADPDTNQPYYEPVPGTVSEGYEAEIAGEIVKGWDLSLGWSAFRAEDAAGLPVQAHHPRKVLRMATRYDFGGVLDGLSLGGSARWESRPPKTAVNPATNATENVGQPAYLLVNAMARYALDEHVSLQVNVNNLFDKHYFNNNFWFDGFVYGEPRNVRATLRFEF